MKSVVLYGVFYAMLINFNFTSADNGRFGAGNNKKRQSFYKHRRGPRLGRCFMDLVCGEYRILVFAINIAYMYRFNEVLG